MKKIKVNEEACIGCGACVAIDPKHFSFNDNGLSEVINQENLEDIELQNAIESCPTAAIVCEEVADNCECENCECTECHCGEECVETDDCECGCCDCECCEYTDTCEETECNCNCECEHHHAE